MNIPFVDLKTQYNKIKPEIIKEINDVLDNTAYVCGKKAKKFEEDFAGLHDVKYCIGVSSGTDALHTALHSIGLRPGDEVIIPVNTFIATSEVVSLFFAKPVFVDHDDRTYNIDPGKIEKAITSKTKAIIAVHLYGQPAEMDSILEIAGKHKFFVIEDSSQAHLSTYKGKKAGSIGDIGTFSFYPGKNLGAYGEAGAVVTNNEEHYQKMLRFRQHGSVQKYYHDSEGHNYRIEEIQAAVLNVKMRYINDWTEKRRSVARRYSEQLSGVSEIMTPFCPENIKAVFHLYVIRAKNREKLMKFLGERGIQTALHYPLPLHLQKAYNYLNYRNGDFPISEKACKEILSLPMYPEMTEEQIVYITDSIKSFYS